jgi:lysophospholipase L1-like esterase
MPHDESNLSLSSVSRRQFAAIGAATLAAAHSLHGTAQAAEAAGSSPLKPGITLLFQGDSITDAGRSREAADEANSQPALGNGYAWLAASQLLVDRPSDGIKIFNRGISGNKVPDLVARWQVECIDLKPNVLSILIGVNDIWRTFDSGAKGTAEEYEEGYHALIKQTKAALPETTLVICEPFVLRCGAVKDEWFPKFDGYRAGAKRVAEQAGAIFVPFQMMFDEASKIAPAERWAGDGVHPSADGAALMAHTWRRVVDGGGV